MDCKWMRVRATGLGLLLSLALLSLALFACNDKGSSYNSTSGTPGGTGLVNTVPQIGGDWLAAATVTSNTCAVLTTIPPDELLLLIAQVDTGLASDVVTPCEGNTGTLTGAVAARTDKLLCAPDDE